MVSADDLVLDGFSLFRTELEFTMIYFAHLLDVELQRRVAGTYGCDCANISLIKVRPRFHFNDRLSNMHF